MRLLAVLFDGFHEALVLEGFDQVIHNAEAQGFFDVLHVVGRRDHDHVGLDVGFADLAKKFQTVHHRHVYVEDDQIGFFVFDIRQSILAVIKNRGHLDVVGRVKIAPVDLRNHRVVFNNNRLNHSFPSLVKHTVMDVPAPFSESICISPPFDSSTERISFIPVPRCRPLEL